MPDIVQERVELMTLAARGEANMADVGTVRTTIAIENPLARGRRHELPETLVDTGAELTWAPVAVLESLAIARQKRLGFRTADGRAVFRDIGYAIVHAGGAETIDEVVFAEPGDMILLGARSLEGLNLRVDPRTKQLVDAGPIIAAMAFAVIPSVPERSEGRAGPQVFLGREVAVQTSQP